MDWISVDEKIPEPFVDVLVWCESQVGMAISEGEFYAAIDRFCIWTDGHVPSFRTTRFFGVVKYWMPLPKPPKE
jgi:Protein of unknown function (DUF551)